MSARDYMAALDAYLDAREADKKYKDEIHASGEDGPFVRDVLRCLHRDVATARCALEREVEPLIRAAEYVR